MKDINVDLAKEHARYCNYGQSANVMEPSGLTDVARVCIPLDIHVHVRPPETFYKVGASGIHSAVTYLIMGLCKELQMLGQQNDDFVVSMSVLVPEVVSMDEEVEGIPDESFPFLIRHVFRAGTGLEDSDNKIKPFVGSVGIFCVRDEDLVRVSRNWHEI